MAHPIWILDSRGGEASVVNMVLKINELVNVVNKLMITVETQEKQIKIIELKENKLC